MIIKGKTILGKLVTIKTPISLFYDADRFIPCDSLKLTALLENAGDDFCEITVTLEDKILFDGIVDRQTISLSGKGRLVTLECRSKVALLLDNEIKPIFYFRLSSDELFARYLKPFGVLGTDFPYPSNKNFIQIKKGSSYFTLLYEFCRFVYKKLPYITRDRIVTLNPINIAQHVISNSHRNGLSYSSVAIKQLNDKIISKLYMKTGTDDLWGTGYYDTFFENENAQKRHISRERYHNPTDIVTYYKKSATKQLLDDSNRDSFLIEVTLPYIKKLDIGDRIKLIDTGLLYENLYISAMSYSITEKSGAVTKLCLKEQSFEN